MAYQMILEGGVLKTVPLQEKPIVFQGEVHYNAKAMGSFYPHRGGASVEVVSQNYRAPTTNTPIIEQPAEAQKISLPKAHIEPPVVISAFAEATIAFDEPAEAPSSTEQASDIVSVEDVAQSLAYEDVRGVGMTLKEFNAYQLKGAQVRKVYQKVINADASEMGISKMTHSE
jgi:hypothetical protein